MLYGCQSLRGEQYNNDIDYITSTQVSRTYSCSKTHWYRVGTRYRSKPKSAGIREEKKVLQRLSSQTGCLHESVKGFCPPGNRWVRANTWLSKSSHTESIFRSTQLENPCSVLLLSALLRLLNELICDYSLQPHWCSLCHCSDGHYRCRPRQNRRRGQTAFHPFSAVSLLMLSHFFFCCLLAQPWGFFCFFFSDTIGQK